MPEAAAVIAAMEAPLMKVRRAIIFPPRMNPYLRFTMRMNFSKPASCALTMSIVV